jgi:hypothetical protein
MNDEDPLMQRAQWVQSNLEEKFGKERASRCIGRVGNIGVDQGALRRLVAGPNAVSDMEWLGLQATSLAMQGDPRDPATREAESDWVFIREQQRQEWRAGKGRR